MHLIMLYSTYLFIVAPLESIIARLYKHIYGCNNESANIIMHFNFVYNYLLALKSII